MNFKNITTEQGKERLKLIARRMIEMDRTRRQIIPEALKLNREAQGILPDGDDYYQWHHKVHQRIMAEAKAEHDLREENKNV